MTALSADRQTPRRDGASYAYPVAANIMCFAGAIACLDADGFATPGATATTLIAVGRFGESISNGAVAGAVKVICEPGIYRWANSAAADLITKAEIGDLCYIVDDQTVAKVATGRSAAGRVVDVDSQGVWVKIGI